MTHLEVTEDDQHPQQSEIMVIDTQDGVECADSQFVTYFQGRPYDGQIHYNNIKYIIDALRQYRQGNLNEQLQIQQDAVQIEEEKQEEE